MDLHGIMDFWSTIPRGNPRFDALSFNDPARYFLDTASTGSQARRRAKGGGPRGSTLLEERPSPLEPSPGGKSLAGIVKRFFAFSWRCLRRRPPGRFAPWGVGGGGGDARKFA